MDGREERRLVPTESRKEGIDGWEGERKAGADGKQEGWCRWMDGNKEGWCRRKEGRMVPASMDGREEGRLVSKESRKDGVDGWKGDGSVIGRGREDKGDGSMSGPGRR